MTQMTAPKWSDRRRSADLPVGTTSGARKRASLALDAPYCKKQRRSPRLVNIRSSLPENSALAEMAQSIESYCLMTEEL